MFLLVGSRNPPSFSKNMQIAYSGQGCGLFPRIINSARFERENVFPTVPVAPFYNYQIKPFVLSVLL
jgi:hypothetical protein